MTGGSGYLNGIGFWKLVYRMGTIEKPREMPDWNFVSVLFVYISCVWKNKIIQPYTKQLGELSVNANRIVSTIICDLGEKPTKKNGHLASSYLGGSNKLRAYLFLYLWCGPLCWRGGGGEELQSMVEIEKGYRRLV